MYRRYAEKKWRYVGYSTSNVDLECNEGVDVE